ncbi:hypothetical protein EYF80_045525 [Liparis tanakae]|uniref:Uncharacterized protein n=1 Tax=Liparis tanakae TaxID=230148 RepID=A0A4Z2FTU3_9TELE|nr:hypothetical protein EYF80_045525 [Liparis tanakae]
MRRPDRTRGCSASCGLNQMPLRPTRGEMEEGFVLPAAARGEVIKLLRRLSVLGFLATVHIKQDDDSQYVCSKLGKSPSPLREVELHLRGVRRAEHDDGNAVKGEPDILVGEDAVGGF